MGMAYLNPNHSRFASRLVSGVCLGLASCSLYGCTRACTQAGCAQALTVSMTPELPVGDYEVVLTTPDQTTRCDFRVAAEFGGDTLECDKESDFRISAFGITFHNRPKSLEVSITRIETDETVNETFTPKYEESRPNGPKCGPVCETASVDLDVSALQDPAGMGGGGGQGGAGGADSLGGGGGQDSD